MCIIRIVLGKEDETAEAKIDNLLKTELGLASTFIYIQPLEVLKSRPRLLIKLEEVAYGSTTATKIVEIIKLNGFPETTQEPMRKRF